MSEHPQPRYAIVEYATNKHFFNIYSALQIERLVFEVVRYDPERRVHVERATAYLGISRARLLVHQVLGGFTGDGWKHETFGGGWKEGQLESRTLTFEHDTNQGKFADYPWRVSIALGNGIPTKTGAIKQDGKPHTRVWMRLLGPHFVEHCLEVQAFLSEHQRDIERIRYARQREKFESRQGAAVRNGRG
jgi:hypothetical protein